MTEAGEISIKSLELKFRFKSYCIKTYMVINVSALFMLTSKYYFESRNHELPSISLVRRNYFINLSALFIPGIPLRPPLPPSLPLPLPVNPTNPRSLTLPEEFPLYVRLTD